MRRLLIVLLLLVSACLQQPIELPEGEVRDYEGEDLSSIADFRENSIKGVQRVDLENYTLKIGGLVDRELELSYEEVLSRQPYTKVVTLYCVEGWNAKILWEGVLISELIDLAGPMPEANTVVFSAVDGYTSSLPLDYIRNNDILLAYKMNNATLIPERGYPFQVVAEDKWGYKWVKWVNGIYLSDNPEYRGYWEQRGYNNDAGVDGPIFG